MSLPSASAVGKAVAMTAVSLVVLKLLKPYLPAQLSSLLPI